ncbi:ornithine carbamoyltransferase [Mahella sp.]|uniref:ornithine carbamoyltransferase n=1 Tax=Mahella sp. TaxID=2798721 RepID=UPI0025BF5838|nr:ornithine carbamoyltransferase [Mahella sp.]MBZ4665897.1 ornithine carbamoyltransferase [Mahella sp.]MDK2903372.1 ornithine carbamoyltransferase [Clostridiales bacterium]
MDLNLYEYKAKDAFKCKDLLSIHDLTQDEVYQILSLGLKLKAQSKAGIPHPLLKGKTLGMIFQKSSTRTRVSFEVGIYQLGGYGLFLSSNDLQLGRGETIADTARVLSRYLDGIMIRTFKQKDVEDLAYYSSIPVINGLTDLLHPCQVLSDLLTVYEKKQRFSGLKLAFIGDGNNMAHSLMFGCAKVGMDIALACPEGYKPDDDIVKAAKADAQLSGSHITIMTDPAEAIKGADVVYTDVWASMGQEAQMQARKKVMQNYQVNESLWQLAKPDAIFMHCLPAHRGEEVTEAIIDGSASVIFDEAENRLHAQKAIMALLMA